LHTEHNRLVLAFKPEDIVADVFAGVGPFVIPAAKRGCAVLGNDLNPTSVKYLLQNTRDNGVGLFFLHGMTANGFLHTGHQTRTGVM